MSASTVPAVYWNGPHDGATNQLPIYDWTTTHEWQGVAWSYTWHGRYSLDGRRIYELSGRRPVATEHPAGGAQ